jgi:hypothetical protein
MTTTAIGIILFSTLFSLLNVDREMEQVQIDEPDEIVIHQEIKIKKEVIKKPEIKKEIPQPKVVEVKTEIKEEPSGPQVLYDHNGEPDYSQFYTANLTPERIANAEYIIRDDMYIPDYLEPMDIEKIYYAAFFGDIANQYSITFNEKFTDGESAKNYMENNLGYKIISYSMDTGNEGMLITIQLNEKTAQEVENVKSTLKYLKETGKIESSYMNSGELPEYRTGKFEKIINEMYNN